MSIVNYMEDKIKATVKDVLSAREDRFILFHYTDDIIAYVLNRVPPRYITSERGFIHNEIEYAINSQLQADIKFCINDAIRTLLHRREPEIYSNFPEESAEMESRHHYFPYIVGEVLDEATFSIISDIEVLLKYNNRTVPMIDSGWKNPYFTCESTRGYYLFWPDFLRKEMDSVGENIFHIIFRHKEYIKKEIAFNLRPLENLNAKISRILPLTLLQRKKDEKFSSEQEK